MYPNPTDPSTVVRYFIGDTLAMAVSLKPRSPSNLRIFRELGMLDIIRSTTHQWNMHKIALLQLLVDVVIDIDGLATSILSP